MKAKDFIKGPVRFDPHSDGIILDNEGNHIVDVRGWGRFQYMEEGEEKHEFISEWIAEAINEKLERESD